MSKYAYSPYRDQNNNNYNNFNTNNNNVPSRVNQRIIPHQPSVNMIRNEVSPRFSISPNNQNKQPVSNNSRWLPNIDQLQQQKQRDLSPILNRVCYDCSMRLFQERVLNQRIDDLQQQNQRLQKDLDNANKQIMLNVKQSDQYKNEIMELKNKKEEQNIMPVYKRYQMMQPNLTERETRSKSDNRFQPQITQVQTQKNFVLYTCKLDDRNIESYYQNELIHQMSFIINKQISLWECLISKNADVQQNGLNYHQIQRKTQLEECYLLKGKINNQSFQSLNEAAKSILPQLIAKYFLILFYKEFSNKKIYQIPQFNYPDLFILQEIDKDYYWIAEKKYKEPYAKYVTRNGEICQNANQENLNFLTAFSLFSYYMTDCNYMIVDIQSYGQNLTEPTINSKNGKFPNDQGIDKIKKFLAKFQEFKIGFNYLDELLIDYKT